MQWGHSYVQVSTRHV
uniref:Uncharacterized protein n=1 Tax=Anguilla anguilla TaxID=7936 RepID=A0A0E9QJJ2_ANGAN